MNSTVSNHLNAHQDRTCRCRPAIASPISTTHTCVWHWLDGYFGWRLDSACVDFLSSLPTPIEHSIDFCLSVGPRFGWTPPFVPSQHCNDSWERLAHHVSCEMPVFVRRVYDRRWLGIPIECPTRYPVNCQLATFLPFDVCETFWKLGRVEVEADAGIAVTARQLDMKR
jgi:hypothetical protein